MSDLEDIVFQGIGEASMCWSETPTGVFDSAHAKRIGNELMQAIKQQEQEKAQGLTVSYPGPLAEPLHKSVEMPNPTPEQVENDPQFNAIWNVIKTWDVNVPEYYHGYCGANGSHVMLILNALNAIGKESREIL